MTDRAMIAQQLTTSYNRMTRALEGISPEEAARRAEGRLAPIVWQVGHLAFVDAMFAKRAGAACPVPEGYPDLFRPGTGAAPDFPALAEVTPVFAQAQDTLLRVAATADYTTPLEHPTGAYENVGEMLVYACFHRGYHVGKTATLRALLGRPLPATAPPPR
jgi:DinB superfamily